MPPTVSLPPQSARHIVKIFAFTPVDVKIDSSTVGRVEERDGAMPMMPFAFWVKKSLFSLSWHPSALVAGGLLWIASPSRSRSVNQKPEMDEPSVYPWW